MASLVVRGPWCILSMVLPQVSEKHMVRSQISFDMEHITGWSSSPWWQNFSLTRLCNHSVEISFLNVQLINVNTKVLNKSVKIKSPFHVNSTQFLFLATSEEHHHGTKLQTLLEREETPKAKL